MSALVLANAPVERAAQERVTQQYLTFLLGGETFAIAILNIKEIIEFGQLTTVPMMPGFIRGVINLRGAVVPVIDLSSRFGRPRSEISRRTCIVIIEVRAALTDPEQANHVLGVVVDAVNEVVEIAASDIERPPAFGARIRSEFISGMGKLGERFVIILDANRVLSVEELSQLEDAPQPLAGSIVDSAERRISPLPPPPRHQDKHAEQPADHRE